MAIHDGYKKQLMTQPQPESGLWRLSYLYADMSEAKLIKAYYRLYSEEKFMEALYQLNNFSII